MTPPRPLALRLYGLVTWSLEPFIVPLLRGRARGGKEDARRLGERLGRSVVARPKGALAWLHGVSVGESLSLLTLVAALRRSRPDVAILVTSGTLAAAKVLAGRLPSDVVHQFAPVDTPGAVRRFIDHWRPDLGVLVESELWPNLIFAAKARGAKLALVSARISGRSLARWRKAPSAARAVLEAFDLILARDQDAAEGLAALGATVLGLADMKFGAEPLPVNEGELAELSAGFTGRTVFLAASTHPGEEVPIAQSLLRVLDGRGQIVIVPRHASRGAEIAEALAAHGISAGLRSAGGQPGSHDVYIADRFGELGLWYRLAAATVLGGSFVDGIGGHNPLEAARLGCPVIVGPYVSAWPIFAELERGGAVRRVADASGLEAVFAAALENLRELEVMAERARRFVEDRDGTIHAAIGQIIALLDP